MSRRRLDLAQASAPAKAPCALYHRVSTVDQDAGMVRAELRAAAAARGYRVELEIEETGSGTRNDRPGLQRVMDAARKGQVAAVLVWKLDRFGRSTLDLHTNISELRRAGVRFVATTQGVDVGAASDAIGSLVLSVLAGVSEFEREIISERTRAGLVRARARGRVPGRPRADVDVRAVLKLRRKGSSWAAVARKLGVTVAAARGAVARTQARPPARSSCRRL